MQESAHESYGDDCHPIAPQVLPAAEAAVVQVTPEITLSAEQMHDEGDVNGTVSTHNSFKVESALSSTPSLGKRAIDCRNRTEMLELLAEVGGGEAPAQDINNWHSFLVMVRIIWNISSERVEGWILQLPTGEVALHFIPVPSFGRRCEWNGLHP